MSDIAKSSSHTKASSGARSRSHGRGRMIYSQMPTGGMLSPRGNIGELRHAEADKVAKIKGSGGALNSAMYLPFRREVQVKDGGEGIMTPLPVREVPPVDKVTRA
jgi:hypothetical protein